MEQDLKYFYVTGAFRRSGEDIALWVKARDKESAVLEANDFWGVLVETCRAFEDGPSYQMLPPELIRKQREEGLERPEKIQSAKRIAFINGRVMFWGTLGIAATAVALVILAASAAPLKDFWINALILTECGLMLAEILLFIFWTSGVTWKAFKQNKWEETDDSGSPSWGWYYVQGPDQYRTLAGTVFSTWRVYATSGEYAVARIVKDEGVNPVYWKGPFETENDAKYPDSSDMVYALLFVVGMVCPLAWVGIPLKWYYGPRGHRLD